MNSSDRINFDEQMGLLCAGFNVPVSVRLEAYWKGMQKMSIVEFARCVEYALGEAGPEKIPTAPDLWRIRKQLRAVPRFEQKASEPEAPISRGTQLVNRMFLQFLAERRLRDSFRGDLKISNRRMACILLSMWLDEALAEDMGPDPDELQTMFDKDMAKCDLEAA